MCFLRDEKLCTSLHDQIHLYGQETECQLDNFGIIEIILPSSVVLAGIGLISLRFNFLFFF